MKQPECTTGVSVCAAANRALKVPRSTVDLYGMSIFAWKDSYSIGACSAWPDAWHSPVNAGKGKEALAQVLQNLMTDTKSHFAAEERLMQKFGYPELAAHKAQHDDLTQQVLKLQRDFQAGKGMLSIEVMPFLSDWLKHHIGNTDRKYVPFVTA